MSKWLIAIILVLGTLLYCYKNKVNTLKAEKERLEVNVSALAKASKEYKFRDSLNAVSVTALNLKVSELEDMRAEDHKLIKELKLKPKDVEYLTKVTTITERSVEYIVDTVGCFYHQDQWLKIEACIQDSSMHISSKDSVAQIIHPIYRKKFLWWKWGVKGFKQEVINFNPHTNVAYSEIITIK